MTLIPPAHAEGFNHQGNEILSNGNPMVRSISSHVEGQRLVTDLVSV